MYVCTCRFIKRLCNFYKPSNHIYSNIPYNETNSKRYSSVGQKLVKYLCGAEEVNRDDSPYLLTVEPVSSGHDIAPPIQWNLSLVVMI